MGGPDLKEASPYRANTLLMASAFDGEREDVPRDYRSSTLRSACLYGRREGVGRWDRQTKN